MREMKANLSINAKERKNNSQLHNTIMQIYDMHNIK